MGFATGFCDLVQYFGMLSLPVWNHFNKGTATWKWILGVTWIYCTIPTLAPYSCFYSHFLLSGPIAITQLVIVFLFLIDLSTFAALAVSYFPLLSVPESLLLERKLDGVPEA